MIYEALNHRWEEWEDCEQGRSIKNLWAGADSARDERLMFAMIGNLGWGLGKGRGKRVKIYRLSFVWSG